MQGEGAGLEIAGAIQRLNRDHSTLDALLVGRGGGSIEDLWAFNEEIVARTIAASKIPIISCVGHETDFTIADFVADLRAPTPSAAAELVSRATAEVRQQIDQLISRLQGTITYQLEDLEERVARVMTSRMLQKPAAFIEEHMQDVDMLRLRLAGAARNKTAHWDKDLGHLLQKLHLLSPLATLSRGYAIAWESPGRRVLRDASSVKPGERIEIQLHKGRIHAEVERTEF
jgi:exodeoxyribonuclease VII large subunit